MHTSAKVILLMLIVSFSGALFALPISGTGCVQPSGDCVVNSSQTIDSGASYYFNSLSISPGVTVTVATLGNGAGGTVKFYIAGDANISGTISASAGLGGGGSSPDGGGYAGGKSFSAASYFPGSGGGVIVLQARTIHIFPTGLLSVDGSAPPSSPYYDNGGGSGGTVRLVGKSIILEGTIHGTGGGGNAGGAGGSVVFVPFTMTNFSTGSIILDGGTCLGAGDNGNGGGGGSGGAGTAGGTGSNSGNGCGQQGGGAGRAGGNAGGSYPGSGGIANPNRNIKIYNSYISPGSAFSISSIGNAGIGNGLLDLYNSPNNAKYSNLTVAQRAENLFFGAFSQYFEPDASVSASFVNSSNRSQVFLSATTDANGLFMANASMPGEYDVVTDLPAQNNYVYLATSSLQDHSAFALQSAATHAVFYPRAINIAVFTPDGIQTSYYPYVLNSSDAVYCVGNTSASQDSTCIVPKNDLDNQITRKNYSLVIPAPAYSKNPYMDWLQAPAVFYISGSAAQKLRGLATTTVARTGQTIKRTAIYAPTQAAEKDFSYTETIPSDFAFGANAKATLVQNDGTELNCTFAAPSTGKTITFSASNCPILSTQLTNGNWVKFEYDIVTPQPDIFTGASKDYTFSQGSLQVNSFGI